MFDHIPWALPVGPHCTPPERRTDWEWLAPRRLFLCCRCRRMAVAPWRSASPTRWFVAPRNVCNPSLTRWDWKDGEEEHATWKHFLHHSSRCHPFQAHLTLISWISGINLWMRGLTSGTPSLLFVVSVVSCSDSGLGLTARERSTGGLQFKIREVFELWLWNTQAVHTETQLFLLCLNNGNRSIYKCMGPGYMWPNHQPTFNLNFSTQAIGSDQIK